MKIAPHLRSVSSFSSESHNSKPILKPVYKDALHSAAPENAQTKYVLKSPDELWQSIREVVSFQKLRQLVATGLAHILTAISTIKNFIEPGKEPDLEHMEGWQLPQDQQEDTPPTPASSKAIATSPTVADHPKDPLFTLPLSLEDQKKIFYIIHTIGNDNVCQLALKATTLQKYGKDIDPVHPIRFLHYILAHPTLARDLANAKKNPLSWPSFEKGLFAKLEREHGRENLFTFLPSFAAHLRKDPAILAAHATEKRWKDLIHYLLSDEHIVPPLSTSPAAATNPTSPIATSTSGIANASVSTTAVAKTPAGPLPDLPMTTHQQAEVNYLLSRLTTCNWVGLAKRKGKLERVWEQIAGVHSLKLLCYIFSDPRRAKQMLDIQSKGWPRWGLFMKDLSKHLRENMSHNADHIPPFAAGLQLNIDEVYPDIAPDTIQRLITRGAWEKLVSFLIEKKNEDLV